MRTKGGTIARLDQEQTMASAPMSRRSMSRVVIGADELFPPTAGPQSPVEPGALSVGSPAKKMRMDEKDDRAAADETQAMDVVDEKSSDDTISGNKFSAPKMQGSKTPAPGSPVEPKTPELTPAVQSVSSKGKSASSECMTELVLDATTAPFLRMLEDDELGRSVLAEAGVCETANLTGQSVRRLAVERVLCKAGERNVLGVAMTVKFFFETDFVPEAGSSTVDATEQAAAWMPGPA